MSRIGSDDFYLEVARGNVSGVSAVNKFGYNNNIATVPQDIWSRTGLIVLPTVARIHDIVSSDPGDAAAGTGIRTIRVYGLDANWAEQQEDIAMNGVTNVPTTKSYTRLYRMKGLTAGSNGVNSGTISATAQTDATVTCEIPFAKGQSQYAHFTIPTGKTGYVTRARFSNYRSSASLRAAVELWARIGIDTATPVELMKHVEAVVLDGTSHVMIDFKPPKVIAGPADVWLQCSTKSATASIAGSFDLILI